MANVVARNFPHELQVFDDDYGYGEQDGMDRDLRPAMRGDGRDLPDSEGDQADSTDSEAD
jgi:hypothetical protein